MKESLSVNPKKSFICKTLSVKSAGEDTVNLEFLWPGPLPKSGQFFLIKPRRTGVFLGRPISVAGYSIAKNDENEGSGAAQACVLSFLVAQRGMGSRELMSLCPGEEAELIGPLGNYWTGMEIPHGKTALVGGGIGIAPLLAYAAEHGDKAIDFYAGFRSSSLGADYLSSKLGLMQNAKPISLTISTEDGSFGLKGFITSFFNPSSYSAVLACGPEAMLKAVVQACMAAKTPCFISTERHMACGVGACLGCTVKTHGGNLCCCTDGPIFNAREIIFED